MSKTACRTLSAVGRVRLPDAFSLGARIVRPPSLPEMIRTGRFSHVEKVRVNLGKIETMAVRLNLAVRLCQRASGGDQIALREPQRAWSYDELGDTVARFGAALIALGVKRGDR